MTLVDENQQTMPGNQDISGVEPITDTIPFESVSTNQREVKEESSSSVDEDGEEHAEASHHFPPPLRFNQSVPRPNSVEKVKAGNQTHGIMRTSGGSLSCLHQNHTSPRSSRSSAHPSKSSTRSSGAARCSTRSSTEDCFSIKVKQQSMFPFHIMPTVLSLRLLIVCLAFLVSCESSSLSGNRYSFSLSTFDPSGKLLQVDRAAEAASKGSPIGAFVLEDGILFASPQNIPSPLIIDDGAPRFTRLSSVMFIAVTGLSADGRIVAMHAERFALNHLYTFDEQIPVETLVQQLSLLFQEYTMKPGYRPFGCTILVGYVPRGVGGPQLFRIDPSGSVSNIVNGVVLNWEGEMDIGQLQKQLTNVGDRSAQCATLADWLQDQLSSPETQERTECIPQKILVAGGWSDGSFKQCSHQYSQ